MRHCGQDELRWDAFDFAWTVPKAGYRWLTTKRIHQPEAPPPLGPNATETEHATHCLAEEEAKARLFLTDGIPSGTGGIPAIRYAPLWSHTVLFQTFAALAPTEESMLGFANQYGSLLGRDGPLIDLKQQDSSGDRQLGHGEPIELWRIEIHTMREALLLRDLVQKRDIPGLGCFIHWRGRTGVEYSGEPDKEGTAHWEHIATDGVFPELLAEFAPGDLIKPAQYYLQRVVNRHLAQVHSRLLWDREGHLAIHQVPGNLLGALWVQFALALAGNRRYRKCQACQRWFELSPGISRADKSFCRPACRTQGYRERKAEAVRLYAEELSIGDISRRLGSDQGVIARWIKSREMSLLGTRRRPSPGVSKRKR